VIRRALGIVVAAVLLLVATPAAQAATDSATKAPKQWDPRVREFVRFVERDRELKFEHPVAVAFLDDAAFVQALDGGDAPTGQDRADAAHDAARLRGRSRDDRAVARRAPRLWEIDTGQRPHADRAARRGRRAAGDRGEVMRRA